MAFEGGCLCGRFRYSIERNHLRAMHCYCEMCRKAHGAAYSTHVIVRPTQLRWLSDDDLAPFESSAGAYRCFCPSCGTHLLVHGQSGDGAYAIPAGTLDGDPPLDMLGHMFVAERVSWCEIHDDLPQHAQWPAGFGPTSAESPRSA